jgi:hypothetical protein
MTENQNELTLPFVAAQLQLSYLQAYHLVLTGQIEGHKEAGHWRVSRASYESYLERHPNRKQKRASE